MRLCNSELDDAKDEERYVCPLCLNSPLYGGEILYHAEPSRARLLAHISYVGNLILRKLGDAP